MIGKWSMIRTGSGNLNLTGEVALLGRSLDVGGGLDHRDVEVLALAAVAGIGAQCAAVPALHAMRGPPIKSNQNGGVRAAERRCLPPLSRPPAGSSAVQPLHLSH